MRNCNFFKYLTNFYLSLRQFNKFQEMHFSANVDQIVNKIHIKQYGLLNEKNQEILCSGETFKAMD